MVRQGTIDAMERVREEIQKYIANSSQLTVQQLEALDRLNLQTIQNYTSLKDTVLADIKYKLETFEDTQLAEVQYIEATEDIIARIANIERLLDEINRWSKSISKFVCVTRC